MPMNEENKEFRPLIVASSADAIRVTAITRQVTIMREEEWHFCSQCLSTWVSRTAEQELNGVLLQRVPSSPRQ